GLAAAAETKLQHPVAEALRIKAKEFAVNIPPCKEAQYRVGLGVEAQVNGYYLHVGNERFMRQSDICVRKTANDRSTLDDEGYSGVYVEIGGGGAGVGLYWDELGEEGRSVLHRLRSRGVKNRVMWRGDTGVVGGGVGRGLGPPRHFADMLPADKADAIAELQR